MKALHVLGLVLVVLLAGCAFADLEPPGTCYSDSSSSSEALVCIPLGGNCTDETAVCYGNSYCNYYNDSYSACMPLLQIGQSCSDDDQCAGNEWGNTQCWGSYVSQNYVGTCQQNTWTATLGQHCNYLNSCINSLWCNSSDEYYGNGTCAAYPSLGQDCSTSVYPTCGLGLTCNLGKCITLFSVQEGGACDEDNNDYLVESCAPGLYCFNYSVCVKGFASSNAICNTTCANANETCGCWNNNNNQTCGAPITTSQSQAKEYLALQTCVNSSTCNDGDPTSCCHSDQCVLYDLIYKTDPIYITELTYCGGYNAFSYCDAHSTGTGTTGSNSGKGWSAISRTVQIAIIAGGAGGVILIAIIIGYIARRNRSQYTQI